MSDISEVNNLNIFHNLPKCIFRITKLLYTYIFLMALYLWSYFHFILQTIMAFQESQSAFSFVFFLLEILFLFLVFLHVAKLCVCMCGCRTFSRRLYAHFAHCKTLKSKEISHVFFFSHYI